MGVIVAHWFNIRKPPPLELVPLEMVIGGGFEDGNPDETLQVESPEEPNPNASPVDESVEQEELMETLETVVELSDRASKQVQQVSATTDSSGTPGSAVGTGGRPLGAGGGPGAGIPAYQRWMIRSTSRRHLTTRSSSTSSRSSWRCSIRRRARSRM
ncbi:MAG: hypothetical protein R3B90_23025 [Planctomycetaceae bacterium]